jgi:hypothetical protein
MVSDEQIDHIAIVASAVTWPFAGISTVLFFMCIFAQLRHTTQKSYWEDLSQRKESNRLVERRFSRGTWDALHRCPDFPPWENIYGK